MNIQEINKIVKGNINIDYDFNINNIKTDSNEVVEGDIFMAINKGHNYINDAIKNGAKGIIIEKNIIYDIPTIKVKSTIEALGLLANYIRNQYDIPVIAVTGSNGKTTTKELISLILSSKYNVLKSLKNQNNHIGLPNTLLKLNENFDVVVLELGMNHFKEISYLSKICCPDYGVITNIGTAHIGNLGNKKNIFKAKLEILDGLKGSLLVNNNDKYLKKIKNNVIKIDEKKLKLKNLKYGNKIEFDIDNVHFIFNYPKHILIDLLIAIKVGLLFNISLEEISKVISTYQSSDGRLNIIDGKYKIIDDSYNSNYESLIGSLSLLENNGYKIIVLGDMLELGKYSKKYHKRVNKHLKKIKNKKVLLVGKYTKYIKGTHFDNIDDMINYLDKILVDGCTIYLKGSRAMNLDKIRKYIEKTVD